MTANDYDKAADDADDDADNDGDDANEHEFIDAIARLERSLRPSTHKSRLASSGWSMSALPPKADICQRELHVRYVPVADILHLKPAFSEQAFSHVAGDRRD